MVTRVTARNVVTVVRRLADLIEGADQKTAWAKHINHCLDCLGDVEAFGTQGHCDPRVSDPSGTAQTAG